MREVMEPKQKLNIIHSIRIDEEDCARRKEAADKDHRSVADWVSVMLVHLLKDKLVDGVRAKETG